MVLKKDSLCLVINVLRLKVGTHDGTSPCDLSPCNKSQGLVASCELATSPWDYSQGLVAWCELAIFASESSRRDQL